MSSKSSHHKKNQATESRLIDDSQIEQRAVQIARDEGRELVEADDRARAREELLAPNETTGDPEVAPELGEEITAWDEAPGSRGTQAPRVVPEDETSIGKELTEKGLRGPHSPRKADQ
jgi:hypothetical protein